MTTEDKFKLLLKTISEKQLHLLGCDFAEHVLFIFEKYYPQDKQLHKALELKRQWVNGDVTDEQLDNMCGSLSSRWMSTGEALCNQHNTRASEEYRILFKTSNIVGCVLFACDNYPACNRVADFAVYSVGDTERQWQLDRVESLNKEK